MVQTKLFENFSIAPLAVVIIISWWKVVSKCEGKFLKILSNSPVTKFQRIIFVSQPPLISILSYN